MVWQEHVFVVVNTGQHAMNANFEVENNACGAATRKHAVTSAQPCTRWIVAVTLIQCVNGMYSTKCASNVAHRTRQNKIATVSSRAVGISTVAMLLASTNTNRSLPTRHHYHPLAYRALVIHVVKRRWFRQELQISSWLNVDYSAICTT